MNLLAFDLDGTLEDSREDMVASVHRVRTRLELPARSDQAVLSHLSKGMEALYRACFDDALSRGTSLETVRKAYEADYLAHVADRTRLYPGIAEAVSSLAGSFTLAVVTNKPEAISRRLLEALGVGGHFRAVVGGDSCPESKPSPLVMTTAAVATGFDPAKGRAAVIGDSDADIRMGRSYGALTLWCGWGYTSAPQLEPHARIARPSDLPQAVARLLA